MIFSTKIRCTRNLCQLRYFSQYLLDPVTTWKMSVFGVFLVRIFPHTDWMQMDTPHLSLFNPDRYSISLRIQSGVGKIRTGKTPNTETFYAVHFILPNVSQCPFLILKSDVSIQNWKVYNFLNFLKFSSRNIFVTKHNIGLYFPAKIHLTR